MQKRLASGELERRVLDVLWNADHPLTPGNVHEALADTHDIGYTTVMTILVRLWEKDVVERTRSGRAYAYRPVLSREERAAARMQDVLSAAGDPAVALTRFVEALGSDEREELRKALRARRRPR